MSVMILVPILFPVIAGFCLLASGCEDNRKIHRISIWCVCVNAALVWACMTLFRYILPKAGKLMLPYLLWLFFAAYLNLGAALLN